MNASYPLPHRLVFAASAIAILCTAGAVDAQTQRARRVAPADLPSYWILDHAARDAMVPNSGKNLRVPVCASVRYTIGSDGAVYDATLAKVEPDSSLGPTAVEIVKNFHYRAGAENPSQSPVETYYTVQFNMRDLPDSDKDRYMAACDLLGYAR